MRWLMPLPRGWLLGAAVLLSSSACESPAREQGDPSRRPNVLFLVSDALRADSLSCTGGAANTPNLCRLADRGVLLETAYANAPWTHPSSVAMFTGNYPAQYLAQGSADSGPEIAYRVPTEERLLVTELAELGYEVRCSLEKRIPLRGGALRGCREIDVTEYRPEALARVVEQTDFLARTDSYYQLVAMLDYLLDPPDRSWFLLHWMSDPHTPYRPPPVLRARLRHLEASLPRSPSFYQRLAIGTRASLGEPPLLRLRDHAPAMTEAEIDYLEQLYWLEIESVDERLGYVLEVLRRAGLESSTLVIVTSDHGEAFGEHGAFLHGSTLYEEMVRVPLIIAGPGIRQGVRISSVASHVDLVPTLADLLSVRGLDAMQGVSLQPLLTGERDRGDRRPTYLSGVDQNRIDAVRYGRYKLISSLVDDRAELYDLTADPAERSDVSGLQPDVVAELRQILRAFRRENRRLLTARLRNQDPDATSAWRAETLEQLRALGYFE